VAGASSFLAGQIDPPPPPRDIVASHYPAPRADLAQALAERRSHIRGVILNGVPLALARREVADRCEAEIAEMDAQAQLAITLAERATITRKHSKAVAVERGLYVPKSPRLLISGSQG
jgi:hypothetical protein